MASDRRWFSALHADLDVIEKEADATPAPPSGPTPDSVHVPAPLGEKPKKKRKPGEAEPDPTPRISLLVLPEALTKGFNPNQERWPKGSEKGGEFKGGGVTGAAFMSPNVGNLTFTTANAELHSARQKAFEKLSEVVDKAMGIASTVASGIGAWSDGAENSIIIQAKAVNPEAFRVACAIKAHLADQKATLVFNARNGAEGFMATFDSPNDMSTEHARLLNAGVAFHTLEATARGVRVRVYGSSQEEHDGIAAAAAAIGAQVELKHGDGEFLGTAKEDGTDREQRDDARRAYQRALDDASAAGPERAARIRGAWGIARDYWRSATGEAVDFVKRLSLLKGWNPFQQREPKGSPKGGEFAGHGGGSGWGGPPMPGEVGHKPGGYFASLMGWPDAGGPPGKPAAPPKGAKAHPQPDNHGNPVTIDYPTKASDLAAWANPDAVATVTPGGPMPADLHGIPFAPWADHPTSIQGWAEVDGQDMSLDASLPFVEAPAGNVGAGVIIQEPDGRVWLTRPTNGFGGYNASFPKGTVEDGLGLQATAIKEAFEETGLRVRITGVVGDFDRTTSRARFYTAERVGGTPSAMGWESQAIRLAPAAALPKLLNMKVDRTIAEAFAGNAGGITKAFNAKQERWPKGSPLGGQWRAVGDDGLTQPPTIAGGKAGSNKNYQNKVDALYGAVQAGGLTAAQVKGVADAWAVPAQPYFAGNKTSSHPKWHAQAAQFAYQLALDMEAKPKAIAAAAVVTGPPDLASLGPVTGAKPGGSNPGALYGDWLVKGNAKYQSGEVTKQQAEDRAKNEVLAAQLMNAASPGSAPEMMLVNLGTLYGGGLGVASKMVPGVKKFSESSPSDMDAVQREFGVQAWLGNYDAIGLDKENTVISQKGNAVNIDPGGAILFRAQGLPKKPGAFGQTVGEWDTMRDPKVNPAAASIYGKMTKYQLVEAAAWVEAVPNDTIAKLVAAHGPGDDAAKAALTATLIARKADIKARVTKEAQPAVAAPEPPKPTPAPVAAPPAPAVEPLAHSPNPNTLNALTKDEALAAVSHADAKSAVQSEWGKGGDWGWSKLLAHTAAGDFYSVQATIMQTNVGITAKQEILDAMNAKAGLVPNPANVTPAPAPAAPAMAMQNGKLIAPGGGLSLQELHAAATGPGAMLPAMFKLQWEAPSLGKPDGSMIGHLLHAAYTGDAAKLQSLNPAGGIAQTLQGALKDALHTKMGDDVWFAAGSAVKDPKAAPQIDTLAPAPPASAPPPSMTGPNPAAVMHMPEALDYTPDQSKANLAASWNITGTVYGDMAHALQTGDIDALKNVTVWTDTGIAAQKALVDAMQYKIDHAPAPTPAAPKGLTQTQIGAVLSSFGANNPLWADPDYHKDGTGQISSALGQAVLHASNGDLDKLLGVAGLSQASKKAFAEAFAGAGLAPASKVLPALPAPDSYFTTSPANMASHNGKVTLLHGLAQAGDVKAILKLGFGINTYGKLQVKYANNLLAAMGSSDMVTVGQKPGTHPAFGGAPATSPKPQPKVYDPNALGTTQATTAPTPAPLPTPGKAYRPTADQIKAALPPVPSFTASSHPEVNAANLAAAQTLYQAALTGNEKAFAGLTYPVLDKPTLTFTGEQKSYAEYPSNQVKTYMNALLDALNDVNTPPLPTVPTPTFNGKTLAEITAAAAPMSFADMSGNKHGKQKFGWLVAVGKVDPAVGHVGKTQNLPKDFIDKAYKIYKTFSNETKDIIGNRQDGDQWANLLKTGNLTSTVYGPKSGKNLTAVEWAYEMNKGAVPIPPGTKLWRYETAPAKMLAELVKAEPGTIVQSINPACTTYKEGATKGFGGHIDWHYTVPAGVRAVPAFGSGAMGSEYEVTLPANHRVKLDKIVKSANSNALEIWATVIPNDPLPIDGNKDGT